MCANPTLGDVTYVQWLTLPQPAQPFGVSSKHVYAGMVFYEAGLKKLRSPSPNRLRESTTRKMALPGKNAIHGAILR